MDMKKLSKNTRAIKRDFTGLRNVFLGVFAGQGIKAVVTMIDSIQLLGDRITAFTGDTKSGAEALDILFQAADLTNQSIDTLAEGFNRIALATQELGLSTSEMIGFTTTLQNAFRIQGASAAEATGATIQLTQGLSSGALRGQELRSVLEASSVAAGVLADAVGITRGKLIKFAETGAFTSEVTLKAFSAKALELNERASKLGTTMGQTLVKATNRFKKGLNELNKDAELSKKFEKSVLSAVSAIEDLIKAVGRSDGFSTFIGLLKDFGEGSSIIAKTFFGKESPLESVNRQIDKTMETISNAESDLKRVKSRGVILDFLTSVFTVTPGKTGSSLKTRDIEILEKRISDQKILKEILKDERKELTGLGKTTDVVTKKTNAALQSLKDFSRLDIAKGITKVGFSLKGLNLSLKDGDITPEKYKEAFLALEASNLSKSFDDGKISAEDYDKKVQELAISLGTLSGKFGPLELGAKKALDGIGTLAEGITDTVSNAFGTLEDQLFDFVKTGKFAFNDFAQAILDDLTRVAIRQAVIAPITGALFGGTGVSSIFENQFVGPVKPSAKGSVLRGGNFQAFASGGVVNSPTFFPTSSGTGLMSEAGPEAIVPLERVPGGDLGVKSTPSKVVVNVNNNAGVEVDVQESSDGSTRIIDLSITKAVNAGIKSGQFDKAFSASYGVNRKGSR